MVLEPKKIKSLTVTFFFFFSDSFSLGVLSRSVMSDSVIPWTGTHQSPLSMGFPRQEYWSELLFPSLGDLPYPGIEPMSLVSPALQMDILPTEPSLEGL